MTYHRFSIIQGRAVADTRVTDSQLRTLSAIGLYADKDGWCWPSQTTIAEDTGKTRKTVNEHVAYLCELGYMEKHWVPSGDKSQLKYRLLFDTLPLSSPEYSPHEFPGGYTNDPLNDPNNTGIEENPSLPVEWQIVQGSKKVNLIDQEVAQRKDAARLVSFGTGSFEQRIYDLCFAFQETRKIVLDNDNAKGNRKAARAMVKAGVQPHHVVDAVRTLAGKGFPIIDLFSIQKTAIGLANPFGDKKPKKYTTYNPDEEEVE